MFYVYLQIHTGDSSVETNPRERASVALTHNAPNLSRNNYLNRGRSPRRPTRRENQEGRFDTTEVWSPSRARRHHGVFSEALQTSGLARSETEISGSNVPSSSLASLVSLANRQQTVTDSLSGGQNVSYTSQRTSDTNNAEERINITRISKSESHTTQPLSVTSSQGSHCASVSSGQTTSQGGSRGGSSSSRGSASGDLVSSGIAAALLGSRVGTTLSIESALRDSHLPSSSSRGDDSSSSGHTTARSDTPSNNDTPSTISTSINSNISAATQSSSSSIASALLGNSAPPQRRLSSLSANSAPGLVRTESPQDDTVFGVSLRRGLTNNQPSAVFNPNVRSLVTSRPPIRRLSVQATFEPNAAVESALAAAQQQQRRRGRRSSADEEEQGEQGLEEQEGEERSSVWREVLKLLSRLESVSRRPGQYLILLQYS